MERRIAFVAGVFALSLVGCNAMSGPKRASVYQSEIDRISAEKAILEREIRDERIRRERAEAIVMADRSDRTLHEETVSMPKSEAAPEVKVSAKPGSVKEIQRALAAAGYEPGPIDGKLGRKTKDAIRRFQQDSGLKADGIVGSETWGKLGQFASTDGK